MNTLDGAWNAAKDKLVAMGYCHDDAEAICRHRQGDPRDRNAEIESLMWIAESRPRDIYDWVKRAEVPTKQPKGFPASRLRNELQQSLRDHEDGDDTVLGWLHQQVSTTTNWCPGWANPASKALGALAVARSAMWYAMGLVGAAIQEMEGDDRRPGDPYGDPFDDPFGDDPWADEPGEERDDDE